MLHHSLRTSRLRNHAARLRAPLIRLPLVRLPLIRGLLFLVAAGLCAARPVAAGADQWGQYRIPQSTVDIDGFTCVIDVMNTGADGYLPISFTANSAVGTFPGDRRLTLWVQAEPHGNTPVPETTYSCPIMLPAGQASASVDLFLPKYFTGGNLELRVHDDDGPMRGYKQDLQKSFIPLSGSGYTLADVTSRLAIILPDVSDVQTEPWQRVPDLRSLDAPISVDTRFFNAVTPDRLSDAEALDQLSLRSLHASQVMRMSETHTEWLGYESVDVILIAYPLLEKMRRDTPARYAAIRDWIGTGGVLWTYAVADKPSLRRFLGVGIDSDVETEISEETVPDTRMPDEIARALGKLDIGMALPGDDWMISQLSQDVMTAEAVDLVQADKTETWNALHSREHLYASSKTADELRSELVRIPLEAGVVVGILAEDPFPGSYQYWHTVRHLSGRNQAWEYRRGTSLMRGSEGYWDWLLANVARPPVYAFLTVLTAFVFLVGPVSYYWTRRIGRLFLMFLIAPVLATIATLALFGYGLIADGLGTQTRIRQITWADGTTGRAARTTRSTYFAAFQHEGGLRFSAREAVYPIAEPDDAVERLETYSGRTARNSRQVVVTEDSQRFLGDFLPARSQRQFVSFRPLDESGGVLLRSTPEGALEITNRFAETLTYLIARDDDGRYWLLDSDCPAGARVALAPLADDQKGMALRGLYQRQEPQPPPGYISSNRRSRYYYWYSNSQGRLTANNQSWSGSHDRLGIFEGTLREMLIDAAELPLGSYAGVAELSSDAIAVEGADAVDSIHIVMGTFE